MKRLLLPALLFIATTLLAQSPYQYTIDLTNVVDDRVKVTLTPPDDVKGELPFFIMPKVIPGSYAIKDYGRFAQDMQVFDTNGNELKVKQKKSNDFFIKAKEATIGRIEYWVEDTWDVAKDKNYIFPPGGSNIEDKRNYLLNNHAYFGYFDGYKDRPFEITVTKYKGHYGSTYLKKEHLDEKTDKLFAPNYFQLTDNPVMYCTPDTTSFMLGDAKIKISNYSVNNVVNAEQLKGYIRPLGDALEAFFGKLPVDEYHFIFYFQDFETDHLPNAMLSSYGALEHHHCSVYYLPEEKMESQLKKTVRDICAHEFLHILTPLNLHSELIADFDFRDPKMSKHLWLYEGVTEYFSMLSQVRDSLITEEEFWADMQLKVTRAMFSYPEFSMTEMSKNVLTKQNQELYGSVYTKGAVMALMLDIEIIRLTDGEKDLKTVLLELSKKYGPNRPFKEDQIVKDIIRLTDAKINNFFKSYVYGSEKIEYNNFVRYMGVDYNPIYKKDVYYFGNVGIDQNEDEEFEVMFAQEGNLLGLREGDIILEIEEQKVTGDNVERLAERYFFDNTENDGITLRIKRDDKERSLYGEPVEAVKTLMNYFVIDKSLAEDAEKLRKRLFTN